MGENELEEMIAPTLSPEREFVQALMAGDTVCSDATFSDDLRAAIELSGARFAPAHPSRVVAVAELGWRRIAREDFDAPDGLVPLYLRAPAIGPQPPRT
jgi:hypothetical protein